VFSSEIITNVYSMNKSIHTLCYNNIVLYVRATLA